MAKNKRQGEALALVDEHHQYGSHDFPWLLICGGHQNKGSSSKLLYFLLISCFLISAPLLLFSYSANSWLFKVYPGKDTHGTICCDRSGFRSDVCKLKGDIRTDSVSSSVLLYTNNIQNCSFLSPLLDDKHGYEILQREKIRPYTRKWETDLMKRNVSELNLIVKNHNLSSTKHECDVKHGVPAVFFSTGGYSGNVYHGMNDVILPLYITSQHFDGKVVFVILDYHQWWLTKYGDVLSRLSDYPVIDFRGDNRTHCFPETIVGLKIHKELAVDPSLMDDNKTIVDFHNFLDRAYWPRIRGLIRGENSKNIAKERQKPRLAIISRKRSRRISNENALVKMAEEIGFSVTVLRPETMDLANTCKVLNSTDVLIGVHGAAMTYFLFMKPGSVLIQIIPLGTDYAAEISFGEPSVKFGLRYIGYKILAKESSLCDEYGSNDPLLTDPKSVTRDKWELTKKIYFDHQNVKLYLPRFRKRLVRAYQYTIDNKRD